MSIFICWSGTRSFRVAGAIKALLHRSVKALESDDEVFMSDDIEKGTAWFPSIIAQLSRADAGIVCLTAENRQSPWMHFEAGALARGFSKLSSHGKKPRAQRGRLFTVLHGITGADTDGPLNSYQATGTSRADMSELVQGLRLLSKDKPRASREIPNEAWSEFEKALRHATVPARELVPELGKVFQRKTFNEPVQQCADQAWLARRDGARITKEILSPHAERIKEACPVHEHSLFEMLLAELDGYAMTIEALLIWHEEFELGANGELEIDANILECCEDRRLAVRSLAGRLLRPDYPLLPEAARFLSAGTNEERKTIILALEGRIRGEREKTYADGVKRGDRNVSLRGVDAALETLTQSLLKNALEREAAEAEDRARRKRMKPPTRGEGGARTTKTQPAATEKPIRLLRFRESSWDLDRIYFYLLVQYFGVHALRWEAFGASVEQRWRDTARSRTKRARKRSVLPHDLFCAARDVEMEVERYRARTKGGSLTPLTYALVALAELMPSRIADKVARTKVAAAVSLVKKDLVEELQSKQGQLINRLLRVIS